MALTRRSLLLKIKNTEDRDAWLEFSRTYLPLIAGFVRSQRVPAQDAADIAQEVFLMIVRKLEQLDHRDLPGSFRGWLRTVARNKIIDWHRRNQYRNCRELTTAREPAAEHAADPSMEQRERLEQLRQALDQVRGSVDARAWACFEAHVLQGRRASDVGVELSMSANAVYQTARRLSQKLRGICHRNKRETAHAR